MPVPTTFSIRTMYSKPGFLAVLLLFLACACAGPAGLVKSPASLAEKNTGDPALTPRPQDTPPPPVVTEAALEGPSLELVKALSPGPVLPIADNPGGGFTILFSNPGTDQADIPDFGLVLAFRDETGKAAMEKACHVKGGLLKLTDLSSLEEGKEYQWEARLSGDPSSILGHGTLRFPLENHGLMDDAMESLAKDLFAREGLEFTPGLEPAVLAMPGAKKALAPRNRNFSRPELSDYPALAGLESLRMEFSLDDIPVRNLAGMPTPVSRCHYRGVYPSGLASAWHGLYELYGAGNEDQVPLYPKTGMHLWGNAWRLSWPLLQGSETFVKLRYRIKGQSEASAGFRGGPGGYTLTATNLGLKDSMTLEYLAWTVYWLKPGTIPEGAAAPTVTDLGPDPSNILFSGKEMLLSGGFAWDEPVTMVQPGDKLSFTMGRDNGQPDEKPVRQVTIARPFAISPTPLTNLMGAEILNRLLAYRNASLVAPDKQVGPDFMVDSQGQVVIGLGSLDFGRQLGIKAFKSEQGAWYFLPVPGKENHPLTGLSWRGSALVCNELSLARGIEVAYSAAYRLREQGKYSFRLPLESEWEACASAGHGWVAPWGNRIDGLTANYDRSRDPFESLVPPYGDKGGPTVPIRYFQSVRRSSYPRNAVSAPGFALREPWTLDMVGNVWEWCQDWYEPERYRNPSALLDQEADEPDAEGIRLLGLRGQKPSRVVRGGAWNSRFEEIYAQNRGSFPPESSSHSIGFRPAITLEGN